MDNSLARLLGALDALQESSSSPEIKALVKVLAAYFRADGSAGYEIKK